MEFKKKDDYSLIFFDDAGFVCKMQYVNSVAKACRWCDSSRNYNRWTVVNVYARRTGRFLGQYRKFGGDIPAFPT